MGGAADRLDAEPGAHSLAHLSKRLLTSSSPQINQLPHLDATVLEESASSSQLVACFLPSGTICGVTQLGEGEIEFARLMPLITVRNDLALSARRFRLICNLLCAGGGQVCAGAAEERQRKAERRVEALIAMPIQLGGNSFSIS